jgi:hypothetical protein
MNVKLLEKGKSTTAFGGVAIISRFDGMIRIRTIKKGLPCIVKLGSGDADVNVLHIMGEGQ